MAADPNFDYEVYETVLSVIMQHNIEFPSSEYETSYTPMLLHEGESLARKIEFKLRKAQCSLCGRDLRYPTMTNAGELRWEDVERGWLICEYESNQPHQTKDATWNPQSDL